MSALSFNPNCGACGGLNSRGYCNYTACIFPVIKTTTITNQKPITNADRFRAMSDEELAELWWERVDCGECPVHKECRMTGQDCKRLALDWLRQEAADA